LLAALFAFQWPAPAHAEPAVVEKPTPIISASGVLTESIGVETIGGVFTAIPERGIKAPCQRTQNSSNVEDGQRIVPLRLFRGNSEPTANAHRPGVYVISGFLPQPRDKAQITITFAAEKDSISLSATDKLSGQPLQIARSKD
jgi:molecular chaperone DnaK (HSP70)